MDAIGTTKSSRPSNWVAALHRFANGRKHPAGSECCELCAAPIPPDHSHLVKPAEGRLLCVCPGCALLLGESANNAYRLVPKQAYKLENFNLTEADWDATGIPIGLAFFFHSSVEGRIAAFYPGPAGPMQSLLDLGAWAEIAARNPILTEFDSDVEALLVNRLNGARHYYRAPIDRCYALVGLVRRHWRGVSGGGEAWDEINNFFANLTDPGDPIRGGLHG